MRTIQTVKQGPKLMKTPGGSYLRTILKAVRAYAPSQMSATLMVSPNFLPLLSDDQTIAAIAPTRELYERLQDAIRENREIQTAEDNIGKRERGLALELEAGRAEGDRRVQEVESPENGGFLEALAQREEQILEEHEAQLAKIVRIRLRLRQHMGELLEMSEDILAREQSDKPPETTIIRSILDASKPSSKRKGQRTTKTGLRSDVHTDGRGNNVSKPKANRICMPLRLSRKKASRPDLPRSTVDAGTKDITAERKPVVGKYVDASTQTLEGRKTVNALPPLHFTDPMQQRLALVDALAAKFTTKRGITKVGEILIARGRCCGITGHQLI